MSNFRKIKCVQSHRESIRANSAFSSPSPISFIYLFQYFVQSNIRPAALITLLHPSVNLPSRVSVFVSLHLSLRISGVRLERCQPFHPHSFFYPAEPSFSWFYFRHTDIISPTLLICFVATREHCDLLDFAEVWT